MKVVFLALLVIGFTLVALWFWRQADHSADQTEWQRLAATQLRQPASFDPAMVARLPPVAQRYFIFTIAPGTPLYTIARIGMTGQFSMGDAADPAYMQMQAEQILAPPNGFLWTMRATRGFLRLSGSDSASWTRFWLQGVLPVARLGGTKDHRRSAFGRYIAEAVFWTPAALLPGPGVTWDGVDEDTAQVTVRSGDLQQTVKLTVDANGQPVQVELMRWSDANPDKEYQLQPFGGTPSRFRQFEGFTLPTHIEAGNFFGTKDYFSFFRVDVSDILFLPAHHTSETETPRDSQ